MSKFPVCLSRNFEFELEISSWDVEISSLPKSKFPVCRSRNFQFGSRNFQFGTRNFHFELEISSLTKSKVRVVIYLFQRIGSLTIVWTGNFEFELEISTSSNWKFRHSNWKCRVRTGNFHFVQLEISSLNWKFRHPNWKFRVAFQARMWHQYAFVHMIWRTWHLLNHYKIMASLHTQCEIFS